MSESFYLVVVPAVLLVALICLERPSVWRFVLLGGMIGLATLTRSEALDLCLFLGVPLVLFATRSARQRLAFGRCLLAGLFIVLVPWLLRNEVQVGGVTLSDNGGSTLAGSYCPETFNPSTIYYGSYDGLCAEGAAGFLIKQVPPPDHARSWTELSISNELLSSTKPYIRDHLRQLPGVMLARVENTWGLARTNQEVYLDSFNGSVASFERFGLELAARSPSAGADRCLCPGAKVLGAVFDSCCAAGRRHRQLGTVLGDNPVHRGSGAVARHLCRPGRQHDRRVAEAATLPSAESRRRQHDQTDR